MAAIFNLAKPLAADSDVSRLKTENQALMEELRQCQTDKEFVWSLWKRLQVTSPDVTQAIGMVVQREKEKAEFKDQKVLEILQSKDEKIDELQKLVTSHTREIANIQTMKLELQGDVQKLKAENDALVIECDTFKKKVEELEGTEREVGSRQAIREMDKDILDLKQKVEQQNKDLTDLERDKDDLCSIRDSQKARITDLEAELNSLGDKYQKLSVEHMDLKKQTKKYENEITVLQGDIKDKSQELQSIRFELTNMWQTHNQTSDHTSQQAELIQQLRNLQKDTQETMKNQESTFSLETANLQAQLRDQEAYITELQKQLDNLDPDTKTRTHSADQDPTDEQDFPVSQSELDLLCRPPPPIIGSHRGAPLSSAASRSGQPLARQSRSVTHQRSRSRSPSVKKSHVRSRSEPRRQVPANNAKSSETDLGVLQKRLVGSEKQLWALQDLLKVKNSELEEVKGAHKRRLERLRSLQSNYRLVKKQLRLVEEEAQAPRKKRRKIPRADVKSLQNEDSDKVWNELSYFRNENRNLLVERTNLQEELDILKVNAAQDMATIYELRSCLEQEREELQFLTEQQQEPTPPSPPPNLQVELCQAKKEVKQLKKQLKNLQEDNRTVTAEREKALADRRDLKVQVNSLQQKDADYRIRIADLNRDLGRIQRELKRKKKARASCRSSVAKKYQRFLNKSISDMQTSFEDFNQDGWEEVSDTDEITECTMTSGSLGQEIADQAGQSLRSEVGQSLRGSEVSCNIDSVSSTHYKSIQLRPPTRQDRPVSSRISPHMGQHNSLKSRNTRTPRDRSPVQRRDVALSPIHFLGAKSTSVPPHTCKSSPTPVSGQASGKKPASAVSSNAVIRQVTSLKQRISTLQHQLSMMKTSRDTTAQKNAELRDQVGVLQSDLFSANQRLQTSRLTTQRLTSDLERLRGDKEIMEQQLEDMNLETNSATQRTEQDWTNLQARLKTASSEVSKQLAQIKNLKTQNAEQTEKIQQLQDRISHLERDLAQKRTLMEDMKVKLRYAQENAQSDADIMSEVEGKLKSLSEANSRYKSQVESFRQRLAAISKQKHENDRKVIKLTGELDRKTKQCSELQHRTTELQTTVVAIEKTAQTQLHALANQSEAAIDVAQSKLTQTSGRLQEHDKFVKIFMHALLNSIQQARSLWLQQKQRKSAESAGTDYSADLDPSLRRAQALAFDILSFSHSDTDRLTALSDEDSLDKGLEGSEEFRRDKKWAKKVDKLINSRLEFALPLTEMFMEKVDERNKLAAKLQGT